MWRSCTYLLPSPHTGEPKVCLTQTVRKSCWVGCSYRAWVKCVTVLLKSAQSVPLGRSPLPWALGVSPSPAPSESASLPLSCFCHIDPLNAFRICRLTSCMCCFSSGERPLGVLEENQADRFSLFFFSSLFFFFFFSSKSQPTQVFVHWF